MSNPQTTESKIKISQSRADPRRYSGPIELVTTPIIWWSSLGLGAILIVLLWSIKGRIPQISQGVGAFSYPFRIITIPISSPDNDATIKSLFITPGDFVNSGDIIAEIAQPTSYVQVLQAQLQLDLAKSKLTTAQSSYGSLINSADQQARDYLALQKTGQELLSKGVISKTTYLQTKGNLNQQLGTAQSYRNNIITAQQAVTSANIQYEAARKKYGSTALLRVVQGGLVLQVNYKPGDPIGSLPLVTVLDTAGYGKHGVPKYLFSLLSDIKNELKLYSSSATPTTRKIDEGNNVVGMPLFFIAYFDQTNGGKINPGMEARILPNNIQANTVGTLRGIVKGVFPMPVGQQDSSAVIGSSELSKSLLNNANESYIQVIIGLVPNRTYKSGYEWVGGKGPETGFLIPRVGDAASVNIITEEKPPITIALPSLRSAFGLPMGM
jgi:hypothetical protein